ncbi:MAG: M23 family metallopeptidase [Alphaproteobacteria bacterium]|nr:M23 family metallopeptidase [Alphaproteobacteria bacterium]
MYEVDLKSQGFIKKYRYLFGGTFFCLAYLPTLMNFVSTVKYPLEQQVVANSTALPLEVTIDTVDNAIWNNYNGNFLLTQHTNDDFSDSLGEISDLDVKEETSLGKEISDELVNKVSKLTVKLAAKTNKKTTVNIPGYNVATFAKGEIHSNFYVDARKMGIPANVVDTVVKTLSRKVNFKHSLKRGDKFEIIYSSKNMLYARIITKRSNIAVYKFSKGKSSDYYFSNGERCVQTDRNSGFGQPLFGRLSVSAPFGWRKHPITGRFHSHSGVDLRATYGTPVHAIYDGVVKRASPYAGYGNCIDIQHVGGYSSRYAHLSRYAVRYGARVRKGQVIGYVGATGMATGAHLHLELAKNNRVVNPLSVKMIPEQKTVVANRQQFEFFKRQIDNTLKKVQK